MEDDKDLRRKKKKKVEVTFTTRKELEVGQDGQDGPAWSPQSVGWSRSISPSRVGNHPTIKGDILSPKNGELDSCNGIPHATISNDVTGNDDLKRRKDIALVKGR